MSFNRRKKLLVDPQVQWPLLGRIAFHWGAAVVASLAFLSVMQVFSSTEQMTVSEHAAKMWDSYGVLIVVLGTLSPVFLYDTLKLSHRFAGPMVSFRRSLKDLSEGKEIEPMKFRKGDHWVEMAEHLNKIASELQLQKQKEDEISSVG